MNWTEPEYPQNLLQIYDPPVLLYVRGDATILNAPALGMVGTRRPTVYGTQMAERISRDLASRGLTIVSGLARGIDAIAHKGATDVGGRAIGVLGTGIDVCYPKENKKLYEKVLERGAIISEFPTGWHPAPENFPVRNRIIAGMPHGSGDCGGQAVQRVVDYGAAGDGVWARSFWGAGECYAGRELCAEPIDQAGAKLVTSAEDVIEELPTPIRAALVQAEAMESEQRNLLVTEALTDSEKAIYELLSVDEAQPIDYLVETSGLNSSEVLATLFTLEMKGIVRQLPGKQFTKVLL